MDFAKNKTLVNNNTPVFFGVAVYSYKSLI